MTVRLWAKRGWLVQRNPAVSRRYTIWTRFAACTAPEALFLTFFSKLYCFKNVFHVPENVPVPGDPVSGFVRDVLGVHGFVRGAVLSVL